MAYDDFLVDKRVVERNIKKGLVEPDALKRQIEALPDREGNLVHVSLDGSSSGSVESASADAGDDVEGLDDDEDLDDDDDDDEEGDAEPNG